MPIQGVTEKNDNHWDFVDSYAQSTPGISSQKAALECFFPATASGINVFLLNNWGVSMAWTLSHDFFLCAC
jgi:hypothetical protein